MNIETYLKNCRSRVNNSLRKALPSAKLKPQKLHRAMRYAVLGGGKRLRSALIYAMGDALHADKKILDQCAVAIELIHGFSLIHDDLPPLDNDVIRHGKPACHIAFDEATAILAGDALLTLAFEILTDIDLKATDISNILKIIKIVSKFSGSRGMAGGEALDVDLTSSNISLKKLVDIYKLKTSCLISASILLAAIAANCKDKKMLGNLEKFGCYLGLAFQIHDDIIGIESSQEILGKPQDTHKKQAKPTYPLIAGLEKAKTTEKMFLKNCYNAYIKTGIESKRVIAICDYIISRKN